MKLPTLFRVISLVVLSTSGCASFKAATPDGFVALDGQEPTYDYRATSHDGVVVAVRALANEPYANQEFWTQAVQDRLQDRGGYTFVEKRSASTAHGLHGSSLRFTHDEGSVPHAYEVTLFVTDKHIYLLEAGGPKALVERERSRLDAFVASFNER